MVARVRPRQLALALPHAESLTRDNFLEGPANAQALALIDAWPDWPNRVMMLVGPEGSGKSHLASIWAAEAGARSVAAHTLTPDNIPGELATGALVVDDLDPAAFDERALFHLLNLAREDEAYVLMTGRALPSAFPVELRDLRSRLRAVPVITLTPPDDQLLRRPPDDRGRESRQLSLDPYRAVVRRGTADGGNAGRGGVTATPAGDPGTGRRTAERYCGLTAQGLGP